MLETFVKIKKLTWKLLKSFIPPKNKQISAKNLLKRKTLKRIRRSLDFNFNRKKRHIATALL